MSHFAMAEVLSRQLPEPSLRTANSELRTAFYQATAIAVATRFAIASGSRNFQPNDISWS